MTKNSTKVADDLRGTKLKAYCTGCKGDRNCEIRGHHRETSEDHPSGFWWRKDYYIFVCCGCDHVFCETRYYDDDSHIPVGYDENGNVEWDIDYKTETWPAKAKRDKPEWFSFGAIDSDVDTDKLDAALRELYGALDNDLLVLASIGIRTAFDICSELLGVEPDLPFERKLEKLQNEGRISVTDREHLRVLVDAGSAAAHRGWEPPYNEVDVLMNSLETFIYGTLVLPHRQQLQAAKMAAIKISVPARQKKQKKEQVKAAAEKDVKTDVQSL